MLLLYFDPLKISHGSNRLFENRTMKKIPWLGLFFPGCSTGDRFVMTSRNIVSSFSNLLLNLSNVRLSIGQDRNGAS